jgi:hypothetical protein
MDENLSLLEKAAKRLLPVLRELKKIMIKEKPSLIGGVIAAKKDEAEEMFEAVDDNTEVDLRSVLGYLN